MSDTKVALITGGSRGIGASTAILLAEHGYDIVLNYLSNHSAADKVAEQIEAIGSKVVLLPGDVSKEQAVIDLFAGIESEFSGLDLLVNNAGILDVQCRLNDISLSRFARILETNLLAAFLCCQQAVARMSTDFGGQGGAIVNVSSLAAKTGSPNEYVDYAASKAGLDALTIGLAKEVAAQGIRVNGVRPGFIYTDMHADGGEPNRVDRLADRIPMKRGGMPEEVAEAIVWLASDKSSFVTGSIIDVAGGT